MRSTINSTIKNAQRAGVVKPTHVVTARSELLTFNNFIAHGTASLITSVPQVFSLRDTGTIGYVALRRNDGNGYIQVIDYTNSSHHALTGGTAVTYKCMRNAVWSSGGAGYYAYSADIGASVIQVKRAVLSATVDPPTLTWSNYGPTFGDPFVDTSDLVRRVEAVCPTLGGVIVAVGTHDFTQGLSTIQFYWLPDASSVVALNTIIQMPLIETYSAWSGQAHHCTFISAMYNATTGKLHVYANDQFHGRAVMFSIQNGVESELTPVIPIAAEADLISLYPASVTLINGTYYLAARFRRNTRVNDVKQLTAAFDCYLTSADGVNWSFGQRSFYLTNSALYGTLLLIPTAQPMVYYCGNSTALRAVATKLQTSSSAIESSLTSYIDNWSLEQVSGGADSLRVVLDNPPAIDGSGTFDTETNVKNGSVLYLSSGQAGTNGQIGVYGIDENTNSVDAVDGIAPIELQLRDYGSKRLIDTNLPLEIDLEGRLTTQADLTALDDLWVRTPVGEPEIDAAGNELPFFGLRQTQDAGWLYTGANDPVVAYAEAGENGNVLMKTRVNCGTLDASGTNYHLSSIGFLFGVTEDGQGNIVLIPKGNGWSLSGVTQDKPRVRALSLVPVDADDPDALDTGWNFKPGVNALWASNNPSTVRTVAPTAGTYRTAITTSLTADVTYDVAVRLNGKRLAVYWKPVNTTETAANWSNAAGFTLRSEYHFDSLTKRSQAGRDWCGLALNTDVPASVDWFRQGQYGDLAVQLTDTSELFDIANYGRNAGTCNLNSGATSATSVSVTIPVPVGHFIRLNGTGIDAVARVASKTSGALNSNFTIDSITGFLTTPSGTITIALLNSIGRYGWASSAPSRTTIYGTVVILDPKAVKRNELIYGRGVFISDDNSAASIRLVGTDGSFHDVLSAGAEGVAWDRLANPIPDGKRGFTGSAPNQWRLMLHHGMFFLGDPATFGLPTSAQIYFRVDNEVIRGVKQTYVLPGSAGNFEGCFIPTFYRPLAAMGRNSSTLTGWRSGGNAPGDPFDTVETAMGGSVAGLLVEIDGRTVDRQSEATQYYATDANFDGTNDTLTLSAPYTGELYDLEAVAVISGRGQDNTLKESHDADAVAMHYPRNSAGEPADIRVSYFDVFSGAYQSVEDGLKRLANLAGVSQAAFRNRHTTPTANATTTPSTSLYSIPISENLANFCLDAKVYIPGNNTNALGAAGITGERWVEFRFRGYYKLTLGQYVTAEQIAAGQFGYLKVGLATTSTDIDAGTDGERWLEWAVVPLTDYNLSGAYSGSSPNYTLTASASRLVDVRIAVQNNLVTVEIGGQSVWTFNLNRYVLSSGVSLRVDTAGVLQMKYLSSPPSYTATFRVLELGEELTRYTAQMGSSVSDAVSGVTDTRRVRWRATTDGGVEFSRFDTRDVLDAFGNNLWRDVWTAKDLTQRAHVLVAGKNVAGEAISSGLIGTDGYSFAAGTTEQVDTAESASFEARLQQRESEEYSETRTIEGVGLLEAQPEDKIALAYTGTGDAPEHSTSNHVITSITLSTQNNADTGAHELTQRTVIRKFVS